MMNIFGGGKKKKQEEVRRSLLLTVGIFLGVGAVMLAVNSLSAKGYDEFGYNYGARMFNGVVDGADRNLDGTYWGDVTYANDRLVMKWSRDWDAARFDGEPWNCGAWVSNEWNGKNGGSDEIWHYKISWVGPDLEASECWRDGGYPIWGQFEVTFSQGTVGNQHFWETHAEQAGYGVFK